MDDSKSNKKNMAYNVMVKYADKTRPRPSVVDSPNTNVEHIPDTKESRKEMVVSRTDQKPMTPGEVLNYFRGTNYEQNTIEKGTPSGPASARQSTDTPATQYACYVDMCKVVDPEKQPYVPYKDRVLAQRNNRAASAGATPVLNQTAGYFRAGNKPLPPEYPRQIGAYQASEDGDIYYGGLPMMNGAVRMTGADVVKGKTKYTCEVFCEGGEYQYTLPASVFFGGKWLHDVPLLHLYPQIKLSDIRDYLSGLVECLDESKVVKHVEKPGWQDVDGRLAYVTPDGLLGSDNRRTVSDHGQRFGNMDPRLIGRIEAFLNMINLTPNSAVAAIIVLYNVIGFLRELFKRAGMAPKFILFVLGTSGSQKTSLALATTQIERADSPAFTMDATRAGLECGFKSYKDAIMLIDDLAPSDVTETRRKRQNNLEAITRSFGDGTGKKRNNEYLQPGQEISQYEAEGGAIITGEYYEGCASSLARNLVLHLERGDVDLAMLTKIQNCPPLAPFMFGFLQHIAADSDRVIAFIRERTQRYRLEAQGKYSHARYVEYQAQLMTAADLLTQYGVDTNQIPEARGTQLNALLYRAITQTIVQNDIESIDKSQIRILCSALVTGIDQRYLPVFQFGAPVERGLHVILEDETSYYIQQTDILDIKSRYDEANGINSYKVSANSLAKLLAENQLVDEIKEGDRIRYGKKYSRYGNTRYVRIDKAKLNQIAAD